MFKDLKPQKVWEYFELICSIPHESHNEAALAIRLAKEAEKLGCKAVIDETGNLLITKAAVAGCENVHGVTLQAHLDMVCEKNAATVHDFAADSIKAKIVDGKVVAEGTTLGADNGIGIAVAFAILADDTIKHGPLEVLLTVNEEGGLTGAQGFKGGVLQSKYLLNLDSEEFGVITIGSAGFAKTAAIRDFEKVAPVPGKKLYRFSVTGLRGGHSGVEIGKGLGNAVKIVARFLCAYGYDFDIDLVTFNGGKQDNAIPREAVAEFMMYGDFETDLRQEIEKMQLALCNELKSVDPDVRLSLVQLDEIPDFVISGQDAAVILSFINACPHGVIKMMSDVPGLPMVSSNCAAVITHEDYIKVLTSQRSMIDSALGAITSRVGSLCFLAGFEFVQNTDCSAWQPDVQSGLLEVARAVYKKQTRKEARVEAIHAGLECGIILEKYPEIEAISIGPDINNPHCPDENLEIASVEKFYKYVVKLVETLAVK